MFINYFIAQITYLQENDFNLKILSVKIHLIFIRILLVKNKSILTAFKQVL